MAGEAPTATPTISTERVARVDHGAEPGREPAAADGDHDALDLRERLEDLERDRAAAASLDRRGHRRARRSGVALRRESCARGLRGVVVRARSISMSSAPRSMMPCFLTRGVPLRDDDRRDDRRATRRPGDSFAVVSGRGAYDPEPRPLADRSAELQERAPDFERAGRLQVFPFREESSASEGDRLDGSEHDRFAEERGEAAGEGDEGFGGVGHRALQAWILRRITPKSANGGNRPCRRILKRRSFSKGSGSVRPIKGAVPGGLTTARRFEEENPREGVAPEQGDGEPGAEGQLR